MAKSKIKTVHGRKTWNLDGTPAFEIDVTLRYGARGRVTTPCPNPDYQTSTDFEQVIAYITTDLHNQLRGQSATDQIACDQLLSELRASSEDLPAAPYLFKAVSQACLLAASNIEKLPLWQYLGTFLGLSDSDTLPLPIIDLLTSRQDSCPSCLIDTYSAVPIGASSFFEALVWCQRVHKKVQKSEYFTAENDDQVLAQMTRAIETAGLRPGADMAIAIRIREAQVNETGQYVFRGQEQAITSDSLSGQYVDWASDFPVVSIERPFAAQDLEAFRRLTWAVGKRTQVIAPPLSNRNQTDPFRQDIGQTGNAILVSGDGMRTISDIEALKLFADERSMGTLIQVNANGLTGTLPIHLAVGWGINQIKSGPPSDPASLMVWREGMRISEAMALTDRERFQIDGSLPARSLFAWG